MRRRQPFSTWVWVAAILTGCGGSAVVATSTTTVPVTSTTTPVSSTGTPEATSTTRASPATSLTSTTAPVDRPLTGSVVVLDPGHNGQNHSHLEEINRLVDIGTGTKPCNTTGTATVGGYPESRFNWEVATRARDRLAALGATVVLTRSDDEGWGPCITERAAIGNAAGADAVVSVHADGGPASGRGFHVIYPPAIPGLTEDIADASLRLAVVLRDAYTAGTGIPYATYLGTDGLSERSDLGGLNLSDVPAVFLEAGNMRNEVDAALLTDPDFQDSIADALVAGLVEYLTG